MTIWLLLAGEYAPAQWSIGDDDIVIAVDGGIAHAAHLNIQPTVWIGDFDSADEGAQQRYPSIPRQTHPEDKDATDFELALDYVKTLNKPADTLSIIGGLGGEFDHTFANLWVLPRLAIHAILWGRDQHIVYLNGAAFTCQTPLEQTVSIFALTALHGMHYEGLQWPAPSDGLQPFSALASRNISQKKRLHISWRQGHGIIIVPSTTTELSIVCSHKALE